MHGIVIGNHLNRRSGLFPESIGQGAAGDLEQVALNPIDTSKIGTPGEAQKDLLNQIFGFLGWRYAPPEVAKQRLLILPRPTLEQPGLPYLLTALPCVLLRSQGRTTRPSFYMHQAVGLIVPALRNSARFLRLDWSLRLQKVWL